MQASDRDLLDDLDLLKQVASEAGALAKSYVGKTGLQTWEKSKNNPVTEADIAVNALIKSRLTQARPDYGWLSEETALDNSTRLARRTWVVDPIDGTRAFMRGEPYWCVGVGLIEQGEAVLGVVDAPMLDQCYSAYKGGGAYLNGKQIYVSGCVAETGCRMIASESMLHHPAWKLPWPEMQIADPKPNATLIRMCWVASGEWDAVLALWRKSDWDLAPGTIIVQEAGGVATTHLGEAFRFNRGEPAQRSLLAGGKALHSLLVPRVSGVRLPDPNWTVRPFDRADDKECHRMSEDTVSGPQLLHIVIGGELKDVSGVEFDNLSNIDFVGAYPNYKAAYDAWKGAAQRTVDNAEMRYFILHAHKLLDPETGDHHHV